MRNVLLSAMVLLVSAVGVAFATGSPHEVGGEATAGKPIPFWTRQPAMRFQCLWFMEEIGEEGNVARIEFKFHSYVGEPPTTYEGCKMLLCDSSLIKLTNTFAKNYDFQTPVEVYNGDFTIPAGLNQDDWFTIVEPASFMFRNRMNLLMEISWTTASGADQNVFWIAQKEQPGRLRAYNATAETGTLLLNQGQIARITLGNPAVDPTSLGKIKAILR